MMKKLEGLVLAVLLVLLSAVPSAAESTTGNGDKLLIVMSIVILVVLIILIILFKVYFPGRRRTIYLLTKEMYREKREENKLEDLLPVLLGKSNNKKKVIYTLGDCYEDWLTQVVPNDSEKAQAKKLMERYRIPEDYANALSVAKRLRRGGDEIILLINSRQVWVENVCKEVGVKARLL